MKRKRKISKKTQSKEIASRKSLLDINTVLIVFAIIPLFFAGLFQGGYFPWEVYATFLLSLPAISLFLYLKVVKKENIRKSGADRGLFIFLGVAFLSLFFTVYFHATLTEFYKILIYLFLFYIALDSVRGKRELQIALWSILLLGIVLSILGLLAYLSFRFHLKGAIFDFTTRNGFAQGGRVSSTLQYANTFAAFLILPFFLAFSYTIQAKKVLWKIIYGVLALFFLFMLFLTQSRGGLITLAVVWVVYLVMLRGSDRKQGVVYTVSLALLFALLIFIDKKLFMPIMQGINNRLKALFEFFKGKKNTSLGDRESMLKDSLKILKSHPIFGTGNGTYQYVYMKYRSVYFFAKFPHSIFFQVLDELGIVGGLAFLYMLYALVKKGVNLIIKKYDVLTVGLFVGLLGILLHAFIDFDWSLMFMPMLFFFGFGVLLSQRSAEYFEIKCPVRKNVNSEKKNYKTHKKGVAKEITVVSLVTILLFVLFIFPFAGARADFNAKSSIGRVPWQKTVSEFKSAIGFDSLCSEYHYDLAHFEFTNLIPSSSSFASEAVSQYKAAIKHCPEFFLYHFELARLYLQTGNKEAINEFTTSVQLNPIDAGGHAALGFAYLNLKNDTDMAKLQFEEALRLDPKNSDAHLGMGILYDKLGNADTAISEYELAIKYNRKSAYAYYNLGLTYEKRNKIPEAVHNLFYAVYYNPNLKEAKTEYEKFAPIINVLKPQSGEKVAVGASYKIQWVPSNTKNVEYYNIVLIPKKGKAITVKSGISKDVFLYSYQVPPDLAPGEYKLRIYAMAPKFMQKKLGSWLSYAESGYFIINKQP